MSHNCLTYMHARAVQVGSFSHCCAGHSKTDRKPCLARPDMPSGPTTLHVPPPPAPSQSAMIGLNRKRESSKPDLPCSVPSGFLEACAPASYWELGPSSCSATYVGPQCSPLLDTHCYIHFLSSSLLVPLELRCSAAQGCQRSNQHQKMSPWIANYQLPAASCQHYSHYGSAAGPGR